MGFDNGIFGLIEMALDMGTGHVKITGINQFGYKIDIGGGFSTQLPKNKAQVTNPAVGDVYRGVVKGGILVMEK